ncbi:MAG: efflux transporter outer membrane subunit [Duncaniella sp.]|nr:efflux transporter outer membrane subunit [Duncaniella sp.]
MTFRTFFLSISGLMMLAACSGTRDLTVTTIADEMPQAYQGAVADSLSYADVQWWELYTDRNLRFIIERTLQHNRDFLAAAARVEQLRLQYHTEQLNLTPDISANASAEQERINYSGSPHSVGNTLGLKADVAWEANLWGKQAWQRRQSGHLYKATVEDYRAMQMSLIAEAATAYFNLMALDTELSIVRKTLVTRREGLEQARLRYEGGLTSETVYQQAKVEYNSAAALIPSLENDLQSQLNALTLLMGEFPGREIRRSHLYLNEGLPDTLLTGVPTDILRRRPDVLAAELRLKAAMDAVGISYADRFPSIVVSLTGGWENDTFGGFFRSLYGDLIGNLGGTVFDFGKKKRAWQQAVQEYEQARLAYEQCVLAAFVEVQDAVTAFHKARKTADLMEELRSAALKYVELSRLQYRGGMLHYLEVLDAQRQYFDSQVGFANARRDEYLALVRVYKAVGGGCPD